MILYRYIIKEHIFPFLASLSIIVFLFTMQQAVVLLDRIVAKGIEPMVVLEVFLIQLGWILALGIPMAMLSATLMTFGRMSGDVEITAIKASGRNMSTLLVPVISAASIFTVALVFFHDLVLPEANHHAANLIGDISRKRPAAFIEPGVLIRDFTDYTLYVDEVNAETGDLKGIRIFSNAPDQDPSITVAASGNIQMTSDQRYLELVLHNGETHSVSRKNEKQYFLARFKEQVIFIENVDTRFQRTNSSYRSDREKNIRMMMQDIEDLKESNKSILSEHNLLLDSLYHYIAHLDTLSPPSAQNTGNPPPTLEKWSAEIVQLADEAVKKVKRNEDSVERVIRRKRANDQAIAKYMVEVHKKYAIPIACLLFVLIGAPLGIMAKRGGIAVGASYSVFFFITYWGFLITGENMADKLKISPAVGMWTGNVVIAVCGVVLLILMLRETTIQFNFIKNIFNKERKRFSFVSDSFVFRLPRIIFSLPRLILNKLIGILPTYLIGMFLGYAIGLTAAILVIFVTVDYVSNLKRFEQADFIQVVLFYYYYLPWLIQTILPVVLLLSSMFSIGKLAKSSELTAMKGAGINVRQLTSPLLLLGIILSAATFYGGEKIIPKANVLRGEVMDEIKRPAGVKLPESKKGIREYRRNFYYFGTPNVIYLFEEFSTSPQFARNVSRYTFTETGMTERIEARDMHYDDSTGWKFAGGKKRTFHKDSSRSSTFESLNDTILKDPPIELVKRVKVKEEMSYWELAEYIKTMKRRGENVDKYLAELDFKIALPLMNFIVIFLGIAITARAGRKGGAALFGIGLFLTFFYWLITRFALVFAQNGHIPTTVGAWIGNGIFFFIGLVLYRKAAH
ncbi:MAG: LptF/LptG family permease [Chitinispirillaceae bacterium]